MKSWSQKRNGWFPYAIRNWFYITQTVIIREDKTFN
jgi:hypothetical protein